MPELKFGQAQVIYEVVRSGRTTVGIEVSPDRGVVVVRAPSILDDGRVVDIVRQKAPWILRQLARVKTTSVFGTEKEFVSGESFPYLGKNYRLKVIPNGTEETPYVELRDGRLKVLIGWDSDTQTMRLCVRDALVTWYEDRAKEVLARRVATLSKKIGVKPERVNVKHQLKRWGSCTKNRTLNLNWRIVMAPSSIIDYVVVHELCHLKICNHSPDFWQFLGAVLPDYQKRREWLKVNGRYMNV
jgi:predicted metal-dependent hydrolase